jgi:hypothetical protein
VIDVSDMLVREVVEVATVPLGGTGRSSAADDPPARAAPAETVEQRLRRSRPLPRENELGRHNIFKTAFFNGIDHSRTFSDQISISNSSTPAIPVALRGLIV